MGRLINIQIRNCTLKDCTIGELEVNQNGSVVAGLVVGENNSGGSVECCGVVYSTINATAKSQFKQAWAIAGGIAGRNLSSVENCYSRENTINTMAEGSERFFGVQKAKLYACSAGLVGEVRGSGSLKYCIAYYNAISTNAAGGENHQYPAFLVSVNDGAVFNCYGRTSNIKSPELVPEITEPEVTVPVEIKDETLPAEETDIVVDTVAPEATAEPKVTAEPETTTAPETEAPETEANDPIMMVVHPLVATGTGSSSGVATVEKMLLVNLIGFSKELWMDTDNGAVIIHENMK